MQTKANKAKHDQEANLKSSGNIQDLRKTNSLSKDKSESDIKLSRLLSNEKPLGVNARKVEEDSGLQSELRTEESVSFSTALGSNMTVRRRDKPPGKTIKVDLPLMNGMVNKNNDKNDAFIFFRPKKGKS